VGGFSRDLPSTLVYVAIIAALSLFVVAEVLIAYQKYQLKKRYVEELDEYETRKKSNGDEHGK
jgi:TRAP-type C4-dicarboxylate transport system permease small subunit